MALALSLAVAGSALPAVSLAQGVPVPPVAAGAALPASIPAVSGAGLLASIGARVSSLRDELAERVASLDIDGPRGSLSLGEDGRLTILLLGSDYREGYRYLEHTDVIMVVSFDPNTRRVAVASVPRSVLAFPRHPDNPGSATTGSGRVNLMYLGYKRRGDAVVERPALDRFRNDVSFALDVEIDHYAYVRFSGFDALVDAMNGVRVSIPARIVDYIYSDESSPPPGIMFPGGVSGYRLGGAAAARCPDTATPCRRALVYMRSRKGYVGGSPNTDSQRARRQQEFALAGVRRIIQRGDGERLAAFVAVAANHLTTDISLSAAPSLYLMLRRARFAAGGRAVFDAPSYGREVADGTIPYVDAIRGWVDRSMAPVPLTPIPLPQPPTRGIGGGPVPGGLQVGG
ncbi:MAG: LCP family protein [Chloroflexi bacterium]|nr:LCP family protein [Chloroflexota bacterium]